MPTVRLWSRTPGHIRPHAGKAWSNWWRRMTPHADGRWGALEMVSPECDADWTVVINHVDSGMKERLDRKRTIVLQTEPRAVRKGQWGEWCDPEDKGWAATWTITKHHFPVDWYVTSTYSELYSMNPRQGRFRVISACQTTKTKYPGHKYRHRFVLKHLSQYRNFDLFGPEQKLSCWRYQPPSRAKDIALFPYQYHFCAENSWEKHYWSEKLSDAFLAECLPLYWGCPDAEDFFPPESFVRVPIEHPEEAMEIVLKTIRDNEWEKRLKAIREAKRRVMDQYQAWAVIGRLIAQL